MIYCKDWKNFEKIQFNIRCIEIVSGNSSGSYHHLSMPLGENEPFFRLPKWPSILPLQFKIPPPEAYSEPCQKVVNYFRKTLHLTCYTGF